MDNKISTQAKAELVRVLGQRLPPLLYRNQELEIKSY